MTDRARALMNGAIDIHIHSYPDLMERSVNDVSMAELARDAGLRGFLLKSHYAPTAERALLTRLVVPEVEVFGSIVLNHFVGGLNPQAVEALARADGRLVYMPTSDALNEVNVLAEWPPGKDLPPYLTIKKDMSDRGLLREPIGILEEDGAVSVACREVLEVVAEHDLAISTGHISAAETMALVPAARAAGVARIVVTHPESPHIQISIDDQKTLARQGALLERCYAYLASEEVVDATLEAIRQTGVDSNIISTDLGAVHRENPVAGLEDYLDLMLNHGLREEAITTMIAENPARLLCR